jgi:hypothetical protein
VKSEISIIVSEPYPNPVQDQFSVDVVISGNETDVGMEIEIISVNGILVRRLDRENFPQLHVGNNIITLRLDDPDGSKLQPGIYICKIVTYSNGKRSSRIEKLSMMK